MNFISSGEQKHMKKIQLSIIMSKVLSAGLDFWKSSLLPLKSKKFYFTNSMQIGPGTLIVLFR